MSPLDVQDTMLDDGPHRVVFPLESPMGDEELVQRWRPLSDLYGEALGIAPSLLLAMIRVESEGDPWAYNPEPPYRYLWDVRRRAPFRRLTAAEIASERPPTDFPSPATGVDPDAEWWGQQASFGLLQVMGAVARERGYRGRSLLRTCQPGLNIALGATHLRWLLDTQAGGDIWQAVGMYNGGPGFSNPAYIGKVREALTGIQEAMS